MAKFIDLTGKVFSRLTVISRAPNNKQGKACWFARCKCGTIKIIAAADFKKGTTSCGCYQRQRAAEVSKTHGMSGHPAYWVWRSMCDRCRLSTHQAWKNYGGRGIRVCSRWKDSFEDFWVDMGPTYLFGLTIERRDNDGNYNPGNCYWATSMVQNSNRRDNRRIYTPWGYLTIAQAARCSGIGETTLLYRLNARVHRDHIFDKPDTTRTLPR